MTEDMENGSGGGLSRRGELWLREVNGSKEGMVDNIKRILI